MPHDSKSPGIAIAIMKKRGSGEEGDTETGLSEEETIASSEVMSALKNGDGEAFGTALKSLVELCHGG